MLSSLLLATSLLVGPAPADAELPPVAADAAWVAHLDVRAALRSELLQQVLAAEGRSLESLPWDEMQERLGLDPREAVSTITAYGAGTRPGEAVVLVRTTAALAPALERVQLLVKRQTVEVGGLALHRWQEFDGGGDAVYSYFAQGEGEQRLLVVSPVAEQVVAAVAVLRGEAPALSASALPVPSRAGTLLTASVPRGVAELAATTDAPQVARVLQSLRLSVGEHDQRLFVQAEAVAVSAEDARQIVQVVQGALALAGLAADSQPEAQALVPLLSRLSVSVDDRTVRLSFEESLSRLMQALGEAQGARRTNGDGARTAEPTGDERWR